MSAHDMIPHVVCVDVLVMLAIQWLYAGVLSLDLQNAPIYVTKQGESLSDVCHFKQGSAIRYRFKFSEEKPGSRTSSIKGMLCADSDQNVGVFGKEHREAGTIGHVG